MKSVQMMIISIVVGIIIGQYLIGAIEHGPGSLAFQANDIERKVDRLTDQRDRQRYAANLVNFCNHEKRGFRSLSCIHWTEKFLEEIASGTTTQRLRFPNQE